MKKKNIILVFFLLILFTSKIFPQSGWIRQSPIPFAPASRSIKFINNNTGVSVGGLGKIIKTTNGGTNWRDINSGTTKYLKYLVFINSNTGFAIGDSSIIIKTTNTGENWSISYNLNSRPSFNSIYFIDSNTGFAYRDTSNVILKTTNCGNSWISINTDLMRYSYLQSLFFSDENTGYYYGFNIFKTTNGGINWILKDISPYIVYCLHFFNQNTGIASGLGSSVIKTTNAGENWVYLTQLSLGGDPIDVKFLDSLNGYFFCGSGGFTYRTTDMGSNWIPLMNSGGLGNYSSFDFPDINTGYIMADLTRIIKTTNARENWDAISSGTRKSLKSIHFANNNTGFAVGEEEILKTTNVGNMWVSLSAYNYGYFYDVHCLNTNNIIATTQSTIQKTTNGGFYWVIKKNITTGIDASCFINNTIYYLSDSIMGKSTDAGETWQEYYSEINFIDKIFFTNESTGFAGNPRPDIYKTTNGGINWNLIFTYNLFDDITSLQFTDSINGFLTTYSHFLKTTNGGYNWEIYQSPNYTIFSSLYMLNENTGYVTCNGGYIIKTTNSGQNWIFQNSGVNTKLNYIYFLNLNTGYTVGELGAILKTTDGGGSVWINSQNEKIPDEYMLYQNYPNPFNPTTRIKYSVLSIQNVKLVVYDVLGKEVETLVNEKQSAGIYEVYFDGSKLASGVYFYKIQVEDPARWTGEFVKVKKMVLIK